MTIHERCCDHRRRDRVRALPVDGDGFAALNGLDALEVHDGPGVPAAERQRRLFVAFLHRLRDDLSPANFQVIGGERIVGVKVVAIERIGDRTLALDLDRAGDFSRYTLRLCTDADHLRPPPGYDPRLSEIEFSFKVECTGEGEPLTSFECGPAPAPAPAPDIDAPAPDIDALARDYQGFRRLILDRLATLVPGYRGDNPADLGVILAEILAYAADQRTYAQDAIATEAYLGTARRRVSVRRHARLVDYFMHEGCNARALVQLVVQDDHEPPIPAGTPIFTRLAGRPPRVDPAEAEALLPRAHAVFETVEATRPLRVDHNRIAFYTWDDERCALPRGATGATLRGALGRLAPGDLLILEQVRGEASGEPEDADPERRHPVRLTSVAVDVDPLGGAAITEVRWADADALPFDLPLAAPGRPDLSVASGNIVVADHGRTIAGEDLGAVPEARLRRRPTEPRAAAACCDDDDAALLLPPRYEPALARGPLTHRAGYDPRGPAAAIRRQDVRAAVPALEVREVGRAAPWRAVRDLLSAGPDALALVAETDDQGIAALRFGDGAHGRRPAPGARFVARYRIGNGPAGNLGAEALHHIAWSDPAIVAVRSPLPAEGGVAPESLAEVRLLAPHAFRRQERAVTAGDYAALCERSPQVQRAAASLRWTGSFYTAFVQIDPSAGRALDAGARAGLLAALDAARMAGHDVALAEPIDVPLELELEVCARPGHARGDVKAALLRALGAGGFFHPDNFTFGQPVHLSRIVALVQSTPGVAHAEVVALRRQGRPDTDAVLSGELQVGPREIVRLDNDPNFPERGVLRLRVGGGK
ncbi:MAG: putative baseplate assembly protein [Nannocystaceae bacterium]